MNLSSFFNPKSVAVIGASPNKIKVGYSLIKNLISGRKRKIYAINPAYKKVLNLPTFKSVLDVKDKIDLALLALPAKIVPDILEECGRKKIPNVIIISSGFKESGSTGRELENKIRIITKKYKITLLGPNCLGIIDTQSNINASFAPGMPPKGHIAFVSQSGALGAAIIDWIKSRGIGFSKFISLGNEAGLTEIEILKLLYSDKNTKAILLYLEKINDGKKFMNLTKKISRKKPIVVLRAGRSLKGIAAVSSHTGSLTPESFVFEAACRESGAITVETIRQFFNFAKLFHMNIFKPIKRLAVLTNGGGLSVITADLIDFSKSLELATISRFAKSALKKVLPPMAATSNPTDIIGDALSDRYENSLKILTKEKNIEGIIVILTPQMMTQTQETAKILAKFSKIKPIFPVFIGGESIYEALLEFKKIGLVNFDCPGDIIEVLDRMNPINKKSSTSNRRLPSDNYKMMNFYEIKNLFAKYLIPVEGEFIESKSKLPNIFTKFNKVTAMKVMSPDVIHKTEFKAVKLNISNLSEAERAWDEIVNSIKTINPNAKIDGMIIQPMVKGKELIIGMKRDKTFGPVILFGMGGIFTEALKDVSSRIAPTNSSEAKKMIKEIKGYSILKGLRGEKPVAFEKLESLIVKISKLAIENPQIKEIDLNPVIATENEIKIVDVRVFID